MKITRKGWRLSSPGPLIAVSDGADHDFAVEYIGDDQAYSETLARVTLDLIRKPINYGAICMAKASSIHQRLQLLKQKFSVKPITKRTYIMEFLSASLCIAAVAGLNVEQTTENVNNDSSKGSERYKDGKNHRYWSIVESYRLANGVSAKRQVSLDGPLAPTVGKSF